MDSERLRNVSRTFNMITGKTGRRIRALAEISEWSNTVQSFLTQYDLYGSDELGTLLEKDGDAKFDLVGITYKGKPMQKLAKILKDTEIPDLVAILVAGAESIRRYLMNPELQAVPLRKATLNLRLDYEKLKSAINEFPEED